MPKYGKRIISDYDTLAERLSRQLPGADKGEARYSLREAAKFFNGLEGLIRNQSPLADALRELIGLFLKRNNGNQ